LSEVGHTFVVAGYIQPEKELLIVDPNYPQPGYREFSFEAFSKIWNSRKVGGEFRAAVFTTPPD
jgi:hypothetical protein